jgi:hypothetical protein
MAAEAGTLEEFEGVPPRGRGRDNRPGDGDGVGDGGGGGGGTRGGWGGEGGGWDAAPLSTMNATLRDMCERVREQLNDLQGEHSRGKNAENQLVVFNDSFPLHTPARAHHAATMKHRRRTRPTAPHAVNVAVRLCESIFHLGRWCRAPPKLWVPNVLRVLVTTRLHLQHSTTPSSFLTPPLYK